MCIILKILFLLLRLISYYSVDYKKSCYTVWFHITMLFNWQVYGFFLKITVLHSWKEKQPMEGILKFKMLLLKIYIYFSKGESGQSLSSPEG